MSDRAWMEEMRKQAEFDRDNGRLNTVVDNHCLLAVLAEVAALRTERDAAREALAFNGARAVAAEARLAALEEALTTLALDWRRRAVTEDPVTGSVVNHAFFECAYDLAGLRARLTQTEPTSGKAQP